jgi:hypothetical protein
MINETILLNAGVASLIIGIVFLAVGIGVLIICRLRRGQSKRFQYLTLFMIPGSIFTVCGTIALAVVFGILPLS